MVITVITIIITLSSERTLTGCPNKWTSTVFVLMSLPAIDDVFMMCCWRKGMTSFSIEDIFQQLVYEPLLKRLNLEQARVRKKTTWKVQSSTHAARTKNRTNKLNQQIEDGFVPTFGDIHASALRFLLRNTAYISVKLRRVVGCGIDVFFLLPLLSYTIPIFFFKDFKCFGTYKLLLFQYEQKIVHKYSSSNFIRRSTYTGFSLIGKAII